MNRRRHRTLAVVTALAATLMSRVKAGEPITLDKSNLGVSAVLSPAKSGSGASSAAPTPAASPSASTSASSSIAGLKGQTAAEQTCSVAASN